MVIIWEVDYTRRIGSIGAEMEANVGTDLTSDTNVVFVSPLPSFSLRPGVHIQGSNGQQNFYDLLADGVTEGLFAETYSQRSFVMWVYFPVVSTEGSTYLWGSGNSNSFPDDGLMKTNGLITLRRNGSNGPASSTTTGWYSIVATNDRVNNIAELYINGTFIGTTTAITSTGRSVGIIGHSNTSQESEFYLGYTATYDHILSGSEVSGIHNAFLTDRLVAEPAGLLQGKIFDYYGNAVSGADVFLIFNDNPFAISAYAQSDSLGDYEIDVPFFGHFTLASSKPSTAIGARALSITLSGTPGDGTIVIHDGKETEI